MAKAISAALGTGAVEIVGGQPSSGDPSGTSEGSLAAAASAPGDAPAPTPEEAAAAAATAAVEEEKAAAVPSRTACDTAAGLVAALVAGGPELGVLLGTHLPSLAMGASVFHALVERSAPPPRMLTTPASTLCRP